MKCVRIKLIFILILVLFPAACSSNPISAPSTQPDNGTSPNETSQASSRNLWGVWQIHFDANGSGITIEPSREILAHFDITGMLLPPTCNDCLKFKVVSFDPDTRILSVDVILRNPTKLTAYDVRGILYTNDHGHELLNADGWTKLWEIPGGMLLNPFKAFATYIDHREFAPSADHALNYRIQIPQPPHWDGITFAVDASWPGNCSEPYEVTNVTQQSIYDDQGASGNISIDVLDWQHDVSKVTLVAPQITGEGYTQFVHDGGNTWTLQLTNTAGATPGEYEARIIADSPNAEGIAIYDFVTIKISQWGVPDNPVEVTPPWLNLNPRKIWVEGDYAYLVTWESEFHVFNVSDPGKPLWIESIEIPINVYNLVIHNGYAYLVGGADGILVVDIDPLNSAHIAATIETPSPVYGYNSLQITDEYAYYSDGDAVVIIDINPFESAHFVNSVNQPIPDCAFEFLVSDGYLYISATKEGGMHLLTGLFIYDIHDPVNVSFVRKVPHVWAGKMIKDDGYIFVLGYNSRFIVKADPPESAYLIDAEYGLSYLDFATEGQYLYLLSTSNYIYIYDKTNPGDLVMLKHFKVNWEPDSLVVDNGIMYLYNNNQAFQMIDVNPPETAVQIGTFFTTGTLIGRTYVENGLAYLTYNDGLQIVDISPPDYSTVLNRIELEYTHMEFELNNEFLYLSLGWDGIAIMDIDPPGEIYVVDTFDVASSTSDMEISGNYLFIYCDTILATNEYLQVFDINNPASPEMVKTVVQKASSSPYQTVLDLADGYAYVASDKLLIFDIDPIESTELINTVDIEDYASTIIVVGNYAYITTIKDGNHSLQIVNIGTPESAAVIAEFEIDYYVASIAYDDDYVYIAAGENGFKILEFNPPEPFSVIASMDFEDEIYDVSILGNYAYLGGSKGLHIIKLW